MRAGGHQHEILIVESNLSGIVLIDNCLFRGWPVVLAGFKQPLPHGAGLVRGKFSR